MILDRSVHLDGRTDRQDCRLLAPRLVLPPLERWYVVIGAPGYGSVHCSLMTVIALF